MNDDETTPQWPAPHYSGDHQPNQHEDGRHITEPVSHTYEPDARTLDEILDACERLEYISRAYRTDRNFQKLRGRLIYWERQLTRVVNNLEYAPASIEYLWRVRHHLGIHPAPPRKENRDVHELG